MSSILKYAFFLLIVRPLVWVVIGLNVRNRQRLPRSGPAIIVSNHNSHLDTLVLMTLFPLRLLPSLRPVAAADYFLGNRALAWFALRIIGILPIDRSGGTPRERLFQDVSGALRREEIVIIFPEGTRGEPERLERFRSGVSHLAAAHPEVPVVPVFLHGLGKALPKGEALLVPFFCDVFIGKGLRFHGDRRDFLGQLSSRMTELVSEANVTPWE